MKDKTLAIERKLVFYINFFLILIVILFYLFKWELKYFFYINVLITLLLSYLFFLHSKKLSKALIVSNLFIFFIFLFPFFEDFLYDFFSTNSYYIRLFYNLFISYLFVQFSDNHTQLFKITDFNFKKAINIVLIGLGLSLFFFILREPVPLAFNVVASNTGFSLDNFMGIVYLFINSFIIALSEELMIIGIFYLTYRKLTNKFNAVVQSSIIFILFHLIRLYNISIYYYKHFPSTYLIYAIGYYTMLFAFMVILLNIYEDREGRIIKRNFLYAILFHTFTDFFLLFWYFFL